MLKVIHYGPLVVFFSLRQSWLKHDAFNVKQRNDDMGLAYDSLCLQVTQHLYILKCNIQTHKTISSR